MSTTPIIHKSALVEVENEVKLIAHDAQAFAVKLFGASALSQFEATIKTIFEQDVLTIFTDAITLTETLQIGGVAASGPQKQAAAFAQIVKDLATAGKSLATNVVNLGIELVVGLMRSKTPAAPPSEPVRPVTT